MSIKDRIEAEKRKIGEDAKTQEEKEEKDAIKAKAFFSPVYEAFKEIKKEFGSGKGLIISVSDDSCSIRTEKRGLYNMEFSCYGFVKNRITVTKTEDFGKRSFQEDSVDSPDKAIDIAIKYVAQNMKE